MAKSNPEVPTTYWLYHKIGANFYGFVGEDGLYDDIKEAKKMNFAEAQNKIPRFIEEGYVDHSDFALISVQSYFSFGIEVETKIKLGFRKS